MFRFLFSSVSRVLPKSETLTALRRFTSQETVAEPQKSTSKVATILWATGFCAGAFGIAAYVEQRHRAGSFEKERWKLMQEALRKMGVDVNDGSSPNFARRLLEAAKKGTVLQTVQAQWDSMRDSKKTIASIIAINSVVFLLWRFPPLHGFLTRHFMHSNYSAPHTLLTSAFSHATGLHFGFNMLALWSFGAGMHEVLGREQFLAMYTSSAVISSTVSHVFRSSMYHSLGASGALYALIGLTAVVRPDVQIGVIFLPYYFPIETAFPFIVGIDMLGLLLKWSRLDHLGHLGGAAAGYLYGHYGKPMIWDQRGMWVKKVESALGSSRSSVA